MINLKEIRYEDIQIGMVVTHHADGPGHWEVTRVAAGNGAHRVRCVMAHGSFEVGYETDLSSDSPIYLVSTPVKVTAPPAVDWSRWAPPGPTKALANVEGMSVGMVIAARLANDWWVGRVDHVSRDGEARCTPLAQNYGVGELGESSSYVPERLTWGRLHFVVVQGPGEAEPRDPRVVYTPAGPGGRPANCLMCGTPDKGKGYYVCENLHGDSHRAHALIGAWDKYRGSHQAKEAVEEAIVAQGAWKAEMSSSATGHKWDRYCCRQEGEMLCVSCGTPKAVAEGVGVPCKPDQGWRERYEANLAGPRPPAEQRVATNVRVGSFDVTHGLASTLCCEPRNIRP